VFVLVFPAYCFFCVGFCVCFLLLLFSLWLLLFNKRQYDQLGDYSVC